MLPGAKILARYTATTNAIFMSAWMYELKLLCQLWQRALSSKFLVRLGKCQRTVWARWYFLIFSYIWRFPDRKTRWKERKPGSKWEGNQQNHQFTVSLAQIMHFGMPPFHEKKWNNFHSSVSRGVSTWAKLAPMPSTMGIWRVFNQEIFQDKSQGHIISCLFG